MDADLESDIQWLLLVYQFPQGPGSLRVKIWRRLQSIGAVAIKNSMYVLPLNEQSREDYQWLLRELTAGGAEGAILEAKLVDGLTDQEVRALFASARGQDYAELIEELRAHHARISAAAPTEQDHRETRQALAKARKRLAEIDAIDFFGAGGREQASALLHDLGERLSTQSNKPPAGDSAMPESSMRELKNRVWVTRRNVRVDRIASAWLIRRRIDPRAQFKFTARGDYTPGDGEVRFDMYEAEFTHQGDLCTFEVLFAALGTEDPALRCVAEIVHDIDLKDHKYERPETQGIASLLEGLAAGTPEDDLRIERGAAIFENLYRFFQERRG